jgi:hypothetical protein
MHDGMVDDGTGIGASPGTRPAPFSVTGFNVSKQKERPVWQRRTGRPTRSRWVLPPGASGSANRKPRAFAAPSGIGR